MASRDNVRDLVEDDGYIYAFVKKYNLDTRNKCLSILPETREIIDTWKAATWTHKNFVRLLRIYSFEKTIQIMLIANSVVFNSKIITLNKIDDVAQVTAEIIDEDLWEPA